jgi:hypothetical protein
LKNDYVKDLKIGAAANTLCVRVIDSLWTMRYDAFLERAIKLWYFQKSSTTCPISNHNLVPFPFMTYHRDFNKSNTAGSSCGAGNDYFPKQLNSPLVFLELRVARSLVPLGNVLNLIVCLFAIFRSFFFIELWLLINCLVSSNFKIFRQTMQWPTEKGQEDK